MKPFSSKAMEATSSGASRRGFLGLLGGALVVTGTTRSSRTASAAPHAPAALSSESAGITDSVVTASASRSVAGGRGIFTMLDHLSLDAFSAQLNTTFHVPDANVSLQLVKAQDTSRDDSVRSFQLILVGPSDPVLSPDTHLLRHPTMGDMALFISPFRQDEKGTHYHVSFSQLVA